MSFLLFFIYLSLIVFWITRARIFRFDGLPEQFPLYAFILKLIAAGALWAVYAFYYEDRSTADIFRYYDDGIILSNLFYTNPGHFAEMLFLPDPEAPHLDQVKSDMQNWDKSYDFGVYVDNRTMIKLNGLIGIFSAGNYATHALVFTLLSWLGLISLFSALRRWFADRQTFLFCVLFAVPSVLFWTSGNLKESVLMAGTGFFIAGLTLLLQRRAWKYFFLLCTGVLLMLSVKLYVIILLAPLFLLFLLSASKPRFLLLLYFIITAFSFIMLFQFRRDGETFASLLSRRQHDAIHEAEAVGAGSVIEISRLDGSLSGFLKATPQALYNAVFRPLPWEAGNTLSLMASVENVFFIVLVLISLILCRRLEKQQWSLLILCLVFSSLLLVFVGMLTPVAGTLVRYKVPALPFLWLVPVLLMDKNKVKKLLWKRKRS